MGTVLSTYVLIPSFATLIVMLFVWKFIVHLYGVATGNGGIHYVVRKPREIKMNTIFVNPFYFEVDLKNANWSGVKCTLSSDVDHCYVQAMWCVPIYELVEQLNKGWSTSSSVHSLFSDATLVLYDKSKQSVEFKPPSDFLDSHELKSLQRVNNYRTVYPFVLLMYLPQKEPKTYPGSHVITSAYALHLPDTSISQPFIIAQYAALSSGHVGQIKKIFHASTDEADHSCLICCQQSASIVQLSCCHLCVCRKCYEKCDKCPICRNTHMDFFELPRLSASFSD